MDILKVDVREEWGSIPLRTWASVVSAIRTFADGKDEKLVSNLIAYAARKLRDGDAFLRAYHGGRTGWGTPFWRMGISVHVLDRANEVYGLGIHADDVVNDDREKNLAIALGIPRALRHVTVEMQTRLEGEDPSALDFEELLRKLDDILDVRALTESQAAPLLLSRGSMRLSDENGFEISLHFVRVDRATRLFCIKIVSNKMHSHLTRKPIWDPNSQETALALAHRIAGAFK